MPGGHEVCVTPVRGASLAVATTLARRPLTSTTVTATVSERWTYTPRVEAGPAEGALEGRDVVFGDELATDACCEHPASAATTSAHTMQACDDRFMTSA